MDFDAPVDELEEDEIREERGGCSGCLGRLFLLNRGGFGMCVRRTVSISGFRFLRSGATADTEQQHSQDEKDRENALHKMTSFDKFLVYIIARPAWKSKQQ